MGSFANDEWYQCHWCGWWGYFGGADVPDKYVLLDVDGPSLCLLCMRCVWLDEPPWWPNNRDRCHEWLLQVFRTNRTAASVINTHREIAEYLADNEP